jgi:osmotically inducible protein OsmC
MINQRGNAVWNGDIKGSGTITTQSGLVNAPYSAGSRFEGQKGTNPEELIGAAHAGCYTMFLNSIMSKDGKAVEQLSTESKVSLDLSSGAPVITAIHITTTGKVAGISAEEFQQYAETAKANCPVSKALGAVGEMTLEAKLA